MKKHLIIVFMLFLFIPVNVFSLVSKSESEYITDEANVLTDETKDFIYNNSKYLDDNIQVDYYVVTVDNLNNLSVEEYADKIYKKFDMSQKGILILISKDDRKMRVKVGEELSDIIYSQIIDEYIEQFFMTSFKNGDWDEGIKNGYSAFYKLICNYYDLDSSDVEVYNDSFISKYQNYIIIIIIWIIMLIGYIFSEYFFRLFLNKNSTNVNMDTAIFGVCLLISMLLLNLTYLIMPKAVIIVTLFEFVAIFSNILNNSSTKNKKKRKKKTNKKTINKKKSVKKKRKITK